MGHIERQRYVVFVLELQIIKRVKYIQLGCFKCLVYEIDV